MKLETMTPELQSHLWLQWQAETPRMANEFHGVEPFRYLLCETDHADWHIVDDTVMIFNKIVGGFSADLIALGLDKVSRRKGVEELNAVMEEHALRRITYFLPHPVRRLNRAAHRLGFRLEGRLKNATCFQGIFEDLDVYGYCPREDQNGPTAT